MLGIIQARSNSKRFYNKVLFLINGKPLIWHVISSVKKSKNITNVLIATSKKKSDDYLVNYLKKIKVKYFRGSLNNVAKRLASAAIKYNAKYFIRINGDSPLIDYKIIDKAVDIFKKTNKKFDLITNVFPRTFPKGQSVEIIKTNTLKNNLKKMNNFELEHVTNFFYNNSSDFLIKNFTSKNVKKYIKLSIDTKKDLNFILKAITKKKIKNFSKIKCL